MSNPRKEQDAPCDDGALDLMKKHGIRLEQVNVFLYGDFRYARLADAVAEAERHPHGGKMTADSTG